MSNSNSIKVNASAVSYIGKVSTVNEDNFYMNGRFMFDHETDNIQVSVESSGPYFIFAVTDGMDRSLPDKSSSISAVGELKKLQDSGKLNGNDVNSLATELGEAIDEVSNLVYSASISRMGERAKKSAFSCLVLSGGKAVVLSMGTSRAYLCRGGKLKLVTDDNKKTERLLKMGIITSEQAEELIRSLRTDDEAGRGVVKKSEVIHLLPGDMFLLCSDGLSDAVNDDRLSEVLSAYDDAGAISSALAKEALENGGDDNITALVVRIDEPGEEEQEEPVAEPRPRPRQVRVSEPRPLVIPPRTAIRRKRIINRIVSTLVAFLIIFGMAYGGVKLLLKASRAEQASKGNLDSNGAQTTLPNDSQTNTGEDGLEQNTGDQQPDDENNTEEGGQNSGQKTKEPVYYKVKAGDTLEKISLKFYGVRNKYDLIMEANGIENPNQIRIDQVLVIPELPEE
ncbi:MAG TPA: LysM peptidoglycan-binding domain-containing protein [Clostridiaceae bacterium]|nr:LysM peptidoglycan-binding domain-containing protein [Clostridiaceae bacterium]